MAFSISEIKSQLTYGGYRPTNFSVRIYNPANSVADIKTQFMVQASQVPSSSLGQIEVGYFGRKIKLAGDRVYNTWEVQVMNDEDFLVRNALEHWSNEINGAESNLRGFGGPQPALYKSQAQVLQYNKTGQVIREYQFEGLWPAEISPMDLDWNATDQISMFSVSFAYDMWRVVGGSTGDGGISSN